MNTSANPGLSLNTRVERPQSAAITGESGNPCSAYSIAGASKRFIGSLPYFLWSSNQPSAQPGTVHEYGV